MCGWLVVCITLDIGTSPCASMPLLFLLRKKTWILLFLYVHVYNVAEDTFSVPRRMQHVSLAGSWVVAKVVDQRNEPEGA